MVWSVAGFDPGGGAGLQADLLTFHALGVHGCTVVAALTAQNTVGVSASRALDAGWLLKQWDALAEDLGPAAIKLGMLKSAENVRAVAVRLQAMDVTVVCDPVMVSTSGQVLLDDDACRAVARELLPRADVLTPNLPEAAALLGWPEVPRGREAEAAQGLLAMGARAVLLKGGHRDGALACDLLAADGRLLWFSLP